MATATVKTYLPVPNDDTETTPANTLTEAQVVSGTYIVEIELTGDTWIAAGTTWNNSDADIICENFEDSDGYDEAGWTELTTDGDPSRAAHSGTLTSAQKGSYCLNCERTGTSEAGLSPAITRDTSTGTTRYVQFYFNHVTGYTVNGRYSALLRIDQASNWSTNCITVRFVRVGATTYKLQLNYVNNTPTPVTIDGNDTNLALNTWYGVRVSWIQNQASGGITWSVDTNLDGTFTDQTNLTDTGTANRTPRYFKIGVCPDGSAISDTPTVQFDMIKVDDDAMPAATAP